MSETEIVLHAFEPVFDENSKILILGTMPSPKSRENGFYYSHPQNRFWRIMARIFDEELCTTVEEKTLFLHRHGIAMWDVLKSCEIRGADDGSIRKPQPNDIGALVRCSHISKVYTTGKKAFTLYKRYCLPDTCIEPVYLPSTSPANCRMYDFESLVKAYGVILNDCTT